MSLEVGIMQGRLLPPFEGRFQAFPAGRWHEEFSLAQQAGLACIEWIYEEPHEADNPLASETGLDQIRAAVDKSGVQVRSVCADYFMTQPLVSSAGESRAECLDRLHWLIEQAARLGVVYIVLPFVDSSSLTSETAIDTAARGLKDAAVVAERRGVELHVECDLPPTRFRALLDRIGTTYVKANYDIGNSAALGYDPDEELGAVGRLVGSVHVKDRRLGGGTVPLGSGSADFRRSFSGLRAAGFDRWFVLQAARGIEGEEVALARRNRAFVERYWQEAV